MTLLTSNTVLLSKLRHKSGINGNLYFLFVFLLVFMANPIGSHILSKAAYKSGHPVWTLQSKGAKKLVGLEKADHSADEPVGHIRKKPAKTNRNQVHKYLKKKGDK